VEYFVYFQPILVQLYPIFNLVNAFWCSAMELALEVFMNLIVPKDIGERDLHQLFANQMDNGHRHNHSAKVGQNNSKYLIFCARIELFRFTGSGKWRIPMDIIDRGKPKRAKTIAFWRIPSSGMSTRFSINWC
jgi:hypothetical protein